MAQKENDNTSCAVLTSYNKRRQPDNPKDAQEKRDRAYKKLLQDLKAQR